MENNPDQIEYRGWRVLVTSPLGFYALVLLLVVPALGAIALTSAPIRGVAFAALILFPVGLIALVTALAVYHPDALRGSKVKGTEGLRNARRVRLPARRRNEGRGRA